MAEYLPAKHLRCAIFMDIMRRREPAICLRATDYSETSQVLCFLTRGAGIVRLLAKGVKRPKSKSGGAIDLLSEGDLVFTTAGGQSLGALIEFSQTTAQTALRTDARRLNTALYMIELAGEMLAEGDPFPEVFDLLHNGLARLAEPDAPAAAVLAYYQWRLLHHVGLMGQMDSCVECGQGMGGRAKRPAGRVCFSSQQGGLLCADCEPAFTEKYVLDGPALAGLAALAAAQAKKRVSLPARQADAVNRLLAYHVSHQLGKPLKMARYAIPAAGSSRR